MASRFAVDGRDDREAAGWAAVEIACLVAILLSTRGCNVLPLNDAVFQFFSF